MNFTNSDIILLINLTYVFTILLCFLACVYSKDHLKIAIYFSCSSLIFSLFLVINGVSSIILIVFTILAIIIFIISNKFPKTGEKNSKLYILISLIISFWLLFGLIYLGLNFNKPMINNLEIINVTEDQKISELNRLNSISVRILLMLSIFFTIIITAYNLKNSPTTKQNAK